MKLLIVTLLLTPLMLTGCASFARRLEVSTVKQIQPNQTARAEAERLLGHPKETVTDPDGITTTRYFFHEFRRSTDASWHTRQEHPGDILFRTLTLRYNRSGVITKKLHDESITPIYRTNAWFFAGPALTPETIAFIKREETTERDLISKLGDPSSRTFESGGWPALVWFHVKTRQTSWRNPDVQRLIVLLDSQGIVRDSALVEHALSEFEPLTLH
jgi:hypothetical protein